MKVVIDISKKRYNEIKERNIITCGETFAKDLVRRIRNGTPLPEHHGRLIDADALEYTCNADECGMLTGCNHCQYHIVTEHEIDNAPAIIEADKEVSNAISD